MPIILTSQDNTLYVNGQPITSSGPALFTLEILQGLPTLTANSIVDTTNTISIVRTQEFYYTAFLTCKITNVPNEGSIGFVNVNNPNTFAFSFDFNNNTVGVSVNGNGSQSIGANINAGDLITIALTSFTCTFFINGLPVYSTATDTNWLNVVAQFYSTGIYQATNIAFGYLANPVV